MLDQTVSHDRGRLADGDVQVHVRVARRRLRQCLGGSPDDGATALTGALLEEARLLGIWVVVLLGATVVGADSAVNAPHASVIMMAAIASAMTNSSSHRFCCRATACP
jgi:hypothetical protein